MPFQPPRADTPRREPTEGHIRRVSSRSRRSIPQAQCPAQRQARARHAPRRRPRAPMPSHAPPNQRPTGSSEQSHTRCPAGAALVIPPTADRPRSAAHCGAAGRRRPGKAPSRWSRSTALLNLTVPAVAAARLRPRAALPAPFPASGERRHLAARSISTGSTDRVRRSPCRGRPPNHHRPAPALTCHSSAALSSHPRLVPCHAREQAAVLSDAPPIMREPSPGLCPPDPRLLSRKRGALPT